MQWKPVKRYLCLLGFFGAYLLNMAAICAMDGTTQDQLQLTPCNNAIPLSNKGRKKEDMCNIEVLLTDGSRISLPVDLKFDLAAVNISPDKVVRITCPTSSPITYWIHLILNNQTKLTSLSCPSLTHIIFFSLQNTGMKDLTGFPNLTVLVNCNLSNSCALENISGLNHIKHINELHLSNNTKLKQITGLQSLASIGYLEISQIDFPEEIIILKKITATRLLLLHGYMRSLAPSPVWEDSILQIIALYSRPYERLIDLASRCDLPS